MSYSMNPAYWLNLAKTQGGVPAQALRNAPQVDEGIYAALNEQNLTHKFKKSFVNKVLDAPLKVFGLTDIDYPFYSGEIKIVNGVAQATGRTWVLDDASEDEARELTQFVVDRANEVLKANGLYGNENINSYQFRVGGSSGRSKKLGKGLFIGWQGDFKNGADYTGATDFKSFAKNLDQFLTNDLYNRTEGLRENLKARGLDRESLTLPAFNLETYPSFRTSMGKVDNTSKWARLGSGVALSALGGYIFNAAKGAMGAGATSSGGAAGTTFANSIAGAPTAATFANNVATGAGTLGGLASAAKPVLTGYKYYDAASTANDLLNPAKPVTYQPIPGGIPGAVPQVNAWGDIDLGVRPSGQTVLRDAQGNPIYDPNTGYINRAMRGTA